ncbi:hypothetical protein ACFVTP_00005, partial [Streptomyces celluloflavus]
MKTNDLAMAAGHSVDPARWQEAFEGLMSRIVGRFARVELRRRVGGGCVWVVVGLGLFLVWQQILLLWGGGCRVV